MGLLAKPSKSGLFTRRGGAFAAVAGLHVVALVIAVNARVRAADEPAQVSLLKVAFLQERTPQEPPPELPPPRLEQPPTPEIEMPVVLIPAIDVPDLRAITTPPTPPPPTATPVLARSDEPVLLDESQVDYLREPAPRYPRAAVSARLQGTVLVWVLIDPEGRPREVRVHRSSGYQQLDLAACDAVSHARFKPYRQHGEARSAKAIVPITFALPRKGGRPPDEPRHPG
jgi:protein TonB